MLFVSLISMCLGMCLLGFILYGTFCDFLTWLTISFSMLGKFSLIISSKISSCPFFFSSSSENESESHSVVSNSLRPHELYSLWNSPAQNIGMGSLSLLQRIFPTQGLNSGFRHCRRILYQLSHKGSFWDQRLLLLGPVLFECWCIWYCSRGLWGYPQFFTFFALYSAL